MGISLSSIQPVSSWTVCQMAEALSHLVVHHTSIGRALMLAELCSRHLLQQSCWQGP